MGYEYSRQQVNTRQEQRAVIVEAITASQPEPIPRDRRGWLWLPTEITITVERERYGSDAWKTWHTVSVVVSGHHVKQDGSRGADRFTRWYDLPAGHPAHERVREVVAQVEREGLPATLVRGQAAPQSLDMVAQLDAPPPR